MKIEAGKYYRTVWGQKAVLVDYLLDQDVFIGFVKHGINKNGEEMRMEAILWTETGVKVGSSYSGWDIISEWQEPTTEPAKLPEAVTPRELSEDHYRNLQADLFNQIISKLSSLERRVAALEPDKDAWRDN